MVTVAIVAILAALAYPKFNKMRASLRLASAARSLYGDLQLARLKAIENSVSYTVIFDQKVSGQTYSYVVIEDKNNNGECDSPECSTTGNDVVIKKVVIEDEFPGVTISNNTIPNKAVRFTPRGLSTTGGTVTFKNDYGRTAKVVVSIIGRIRMEM